MMDPGLGLTSWQRLRTRWHLFATGLRKRLTVGVRAVLLDGKKVLLVRHTYLPGWQFPGGGVEPAETAETAAARETMEEAGYAVDGRPLLHGFFLNRIAGGRAIMWRSMSGGNFGVSMSSFRISRSPSVAGSTSRHCHVMSRLGLRGGWRRFSGARRLRPSGD